MQKTAALLGSALFFLIAPVTVGFVVPWWIAGWHMGPPFLGSKLFVAAGILLVAAGLVPLIESFARFALVGLGTPAPVAPPRHLVVSGFYRYVRNPMYVGVTAITFGNAMILGQLQAIFYAEFLVIAFALFVRFYEEPTLRSQFGAEYQEFCANVPRWLPRLTAWTKATRE
jgi:protein-S-isoprenylcysteine O-methyltransferase Ste14